MPHHCTFHHGVRVCLYSCHVRLVILRFAYAAGDAFVRLKSSYDELMRPNRPTVYLQRAGLAEALTLSTEHLCIVCDRH